MVNRNIRFWLACFCGVVGVGLNTGCVWSENSTVAELLYAPKLDVVFSDDQNYKFYSNGRIFLYDPQGVLYLDTVILEGGMTGDIKLVHGVKPGKYTLLSFCNVKNAIFENVNKGRSKIGELRVETDVVDGDKLFLQRGEFDLRRGDPQVCRSQSVPLYYNMTFKLTNIGELTQKPNAPFVEVIGISSTFDALENKITDKKSDVRLPELEILPNGDYQTACKIVKFDGSEGVKIRVSELVKGVIETVVLDPAAYVDVDSSTPQNLDIEMRYKAYSFELIVNNWFIGEFEFVEVGG